jgi:hypothetical protein
MEALKKLKRKMENRIGREAFVSLREKHEFGRIKNFLILQTGDSKRPYAVEYVLQTVDGRTEVAPEHNTIIMLEA